MAGTKNSGRKPKSIEIALIEKLKPLEPRAFELLKEGLDSGDFKYLRLYFPVPLWKTERAKRDKYLTFQPRCNRYSILYLSQPKKWKTNKI